MLRFASLACIQVTFRRACSRLQTLNTGRFRLHDASSKVRINLVVVPVLTLSYICMYEDHRSILQDLCSSGLFHFQSRVASFLT
jgi:hypothetical protein